MMDSGTLLPFRNSKLNGHFFQNQTSNTQDRSD